MLLTSSPGLKTGAFRREMVKEMAVFMVRIGVLVLVSILLLLIVWSGRRFVEAQRRRALAAVPLTSGGGDTDAHASLSLVRILAFSSADCRQCHEMQIPALQRVLDALLRLLLPAE